MINNIYNNKANFDKKTNNSYDTISSSNIVFKGTITKKDGKNIRIQSTQDNSILDIVTKNNLNVRQGEMLSIKKSEIEVVTKISNDQLEKEKEKRKEEIKELKKLDVKPTNENIDALKNIKNTNIPLTKENILKFASIKGDILNLTNKININDIVNLINSGYDLERMSISELKNILQNPEQSYTDKLTVSLESKLNKKVSYDEAREISDKIYDSKMGKDIYDIIIALKENSADVTKENIDKIHDVFSKLYDIKDIANEDVAKILKSDDINISIDNLYNIKNYVTSSNIIANEKTYDVSNKNIVPTDKQLDNMIASIKTTLKDLGFTDEDIDVAKAILKNGMELNTNNVNEVKDIQNALLQIQNTLDKNIAAMLIKSGVDISSMDVRQLLQEILGMINQIDSMNALNMSEEDFDLGNELIQAMKQINSNSILGNISMKRVLNFSEVGKELYNKLYNSNSNENYNSYDKITYSKQISLKTSIVLSNVDTLNFDLLDYRSNGISLKEIYDKHFPQLKKIQDNADNTSLVKAKFETTFTMKLEIKAEITSHYEYLKMNMRASHINTMINSGINPFESDIRSLSNIIKGSISRNKSFESSFTSYSNEDANAISKGLILSNSDFTVKNVKKSFEIEHNKNNYMDIIKNIEKESNERGFKDVHDITRKIISSLNSNFSKDIFKENILEMFNNFKEIEKIINSSNREDRGMLKKQLENLSDNIKETNRLSDKNDMVQIPFNMNGESNNANVFAKSKKNKKGKIDPNDMSMLIDINTKNLGEMGFFIKVDNKKLSIRVSGNNTSVSKIRESVHSLDEKLSSLGYNIDFIDLVSPSNEAKISFVNENSQNSNSTLDLII